MGWVPEPVPALTPGTGAREKREAAGSEHALVCRVLLGQGGQEEARQLQSLPPTLWGAAQSCSKET